MSTQFNEVYSNFLSRITEDMYMELTELDTFRLLEELIISAIPKFEFPRISLDYETTEIEDIRTYNGIESNQKEVPLTVFNEGHFLETLSSEEVGVIAIYMIVEWLGQQLASCENTRMKYSGLT